jgi:hypothetical protein
MVMSVTVVTLPVFIELLREAACTLSRDLHGIVTVIVTEETPYLSYFLATVTVMTLMTMNCGRFLEVPHRAGAGGSPPGSLRHGDPTVQPGSGTPTSYFDRLGLLSYADSGAMLRAAPAAPYSWVPETLVCETDPSDDACLTGSSRSGVK